MQHCNSSSRSKHAGTIPSCSCWHSIGSLLFWMYNIRGKTILAAIFCCCRRQGYCFRSCSCFSSAFQLFLDITSCFFFRTLFVAIEFLFSCNNKLCSCIVMRFCFVFDFDFPYLWSCLVCLKTLVCLCIFHLGLVGLCTVSEMETWCLVSLCWKIDTSHISNLSY